MFVYVRHGLKRDRDRLQDQLAGVSTREIQPEAEFSGDSPWISHEIPLQQGLSQLPFDTHGQSIPSSASPQVCTTIPIPDYFNRTLVWNHSIALAE